MKNSSKITTSLVAMALLISAAVVLISFWAFRQIEESADARKQTNLAISRAEDLLSKLIDTETGERGYLLTGDESFLEPYLIERDTVSSTLQELNQLASIKSSAVEKHLKALAPLIVAKLAFLSNTIKLRRNNDMTAALANVRSSQGKPLMDTIRAEINSFIQIEKDSLAQHQEEFQSHMRRLLIVMGATSLLTLLFALSFAYLIYRETQHRVLQTAKISETAAHEYAESIINTVREPLISLNQDLRVVSASRSFYEFFRVNPEETVGQLIYDLGNKQWDIPKLRELLETILPKKATFDNYEVEHDFINIGKRIMLLNARQIERVQGKEQIILLAIEDITEKIKLQRQLTERTRDAENAKSTAEEATRAKSDFLANMSHELRTPLNSIIGFSEVLQDELLGSLNASQSEDVEHIIKAGRHLLSLINDILDLSKVESGKMELDVEEVSLKELLEAMIVMQREKALRHGINLDLHVEPVTDMVIEADERKLKQILFNLLSNAVKFTPDGGSVRVLAKKVRSVKGSSESGVLSSECESMNSEIQTNNSELTDCIEITVEDTGIGIKTEDIPKLFKEFSQLCSVYDKKYEGTGLGLALTKKLVELHGGRIQVSSQFGKGSSFAFVIPVKQESK